MPVLPVGLRRLFAEVSIHAVKERQRPDDMVAVEPRVSPWEHPDQNTSKT